MNRNLGYRCVSLKAVDPIPLPTSTILQLDGDCHIILHLLHLYGLQLGLQSQHGPCKSRKPGTILGSPC